MPLLTEKDVLDFKKYFNTIIEDIEKHPECPEITMANKRLVEMLKYNVPHGKLNRGLAVVMAYKAFAKEVTEENCKLAYVLGWAVEVIQAFALILDDIIDSSVTRRGKTCWYQLPNNQGIAISDGIAMEQFCYYLLRQHFRTKSYYATVLEIFHDLNRKTSYGQLLDCMMGKEHNIKTFTLETYNNIVTYKTSYYTFCLPVFLGMILAEVDDQALWTDVEDILMNIGYFFQVQDDYLDCFGDSKVTGKIGTDIQDGKCSWLVVQALKRATPEQTAIISKCLGKNDPVSIDTVKQIYLDLELRKLYSQYECEESARINAKIDEIQSGNLEVKACLKCLLYKINKRTN